MLISQPDVQKRERKSFRAQREQLLTLLNGWDPVGLLEAGAPRDKYDWIVDKLLGLLSRNARKEEVTAFLEREMSVHFGVPVQNASQFAAKAVTWFQMASNEREAHD